MSMRRNRSGRMGSGGQRPLRNGENDQLGSGLHFEVGCPRPYIPLHERLQQKVDEHDTFFSLEFFPPRTPNGVYNFYTRVERYTDGDPLFIDITWHVGGDPGNIDKCTSSTAVACGTLNFARTDVMLHMTAAQYSKEETLGHIRQAHKMGIRNIMCLRGDLPPDQPSSEYKYRAVDMIRWIKEEFGDDFTIACAGYPTGHPDACSYEQDLIYLKDKVDAGAHFIVTQLFFEIETFEKFVNDCRAIGIKVPIIPGILPIMGYEMVKKLAQLSRLDIPEQIMKDLEPIKHDDEAILKYGKARAIQMCRRLLHSGLAPGIHMYTMNREGVIREILKELRLWKGRRNRLLPWEPHGINHPKRCEEDVRPIYWSCRPRSYIHRTQDWDGYPNGRWGNSSSPCFAALNEYYLFSMLSYKQHPQMVGMFGSPRCLDDIKRVFECYVAGGRCRDGPGTEVRALPWSEDFDGVAMETNLISKQLEWCISRGVLTINSQPNVDGADSTDPTVGWGNPGGYVYQRAYLEFFCPLEMAEMIQDVINEKYKGRINFHCVNYNGEYERMNGEDTTPIAVTWGVFPGREVAQPTVVDPLAFLDWKDEAFNLWLSNWASIYPKGHESIKVLKAVHDTYILFTMVDNDFKKNTVIFEIIKEAAENYENAERSLGLGLDNYLAGLSLQNGHA